jgi:hypothetical protein
MAVRVVHKLHRYTLSVARLTAPKPHTSGAVRLANPHAKQAVAQCRTVRSVVPQPRRRAHCRAPPVTRRMQRPLVVQVQQLEGRTDLALLSHSRPSPRPQIEHSAACVHGAPSRVSTQRSTPDAGANARSQPRLVVMIHMLHKFVPQLRAQVRSHLPGEARFRGAHKRAPALRSAPPRSARERVGEVAAVLEAIIEGAQRARGGVGEAVGEARAESLFGDAGEAVVGVAGESSRSGVGTPGGGVAHRGRLLEGDADAAASGVFDGLLDLLVEVVVLQAVTEVAWGVRCGRGSTRHPPVRQEDVTAVHAAHDGGEHRVCACGRRRGVCVLASDGVQEVLQAKSKECVWKGTKEGMCLQRDNGRNVFGKGHRKGCVPFLMRVETCKGTEGKVFANMSAGIDTKANTQAAAHSRLVICVVLRMAASAEAPLAPMLLYPRLRARGGVGMVREQACQWALTRKRTLCGAAAHFRFVIFVLLRMAASAVAPWSPMPFSMRLQGMGGGTVREQARINGR